MTPNTIKSHRTAMCPARNAPVYPAGGSADFEEHRDAEVGHVLAHVSRRRAAGGGDDGDDGCADGELHIDAEKQCERGDDDDSAAQAQQRARDAGEEGDAERDQDEVKWGDVLEPGHGRNCSGNGEGSKREF